MQAGPEFLSVLLQQIISRIPFAFFILIGFIMVIVLWKRNSKGSLMALSGLLLSSLSQIGSIISFSLLITGVFEDGGNLIFRMVNLLFNLLGGLAMLLYIGAIYVRGPENSVQVFPETRSKINPNTHNPHGNPGVKSEEFTE